MSPARDDNQLNKAHDTPERDEEDNFSPGTSPETTEDSQSVATSGQCNPTNTANSRKRRASSEHPFDTVCKTCLATCSPQFIDPFNRPRKLRKLTKETKMVVCSCPCHNHVSSTGNSGPGNHCSPGRRDAEDHGRPGGNSGANLIVLAALVREKDTQDVWGSILGEMNGSNDVRCSASHGRTAQRESFESICLHSEGTTAASGPFSRPDSRASGRCHPRVSIPSIILDVNSVSPSSVYSAFVPSKDRPGTRNPVKSSPVATPGSDASPVSIPWAVDTDISGC